MSASELNVDSFGKIMYPRQYNATHLVHWLLVNRSAFISDCAVPNMDMSYRPIAEVGHQRMRMSLVTSSAASVISSSNESTPKSKMFGSSFLMSWIVIDNIFSPSYVLQVLLVSVFKLGASKDTKRHASRYTPSCRMTCIFTD